MRDFSSIYAQENKQDIAREIRESGIVLIHSENCSLDNFENFTQIFCSKFHHVSKRHHLKNESGDGYSTKTSQKNLILLGHSEGAYKPYQLQPNLCFFMCIKPPEALGGETTVLDGVEMMNLIPEKLKSKLLILGIIYECEWEKDRWKIEFGVKTERSLLKLLKQLNILDFKLEKEKLYFKLQRQAVNKTLNGQLAFANGLLTHLPSINHNFYKDKPIYTNPSNKVYWGNNEEISEGEINSLIDIHDKVVLKHKWEKGQILMIDNMRFMHGRLATEIDCERVIVSRFGWRQKSLFDYLN
jgi:alpha-ketoglutarate-dependent taurine dioxygenase